MQSNDYPTKGQLRYAEQRKSEQWKVKSADSKNADGNVCIICGSMKNLNTHHLSYESKIGYEDSCVLTTLCEEHHKQWHEFLRSNTKTLERIENDFENDLREALQAPLKKREKEIRKLIGKGIHELTIGNTKSGLDGKLEPMLRRSLSTVKSTAGEHLLTKEIIIQTGDHCGLTKQFNAKFKHAPNAQQWCCAAYRQNNKNNTPEIWLEKWDESECTIELIRTDKRGGYIND